MNLREDTITFSTQRSVKEIGQTLQVVLARLKSTSIEQISSGSGALEVFDDHADIEIVAQGGEPIMGLSTGSWAVQIYVVDRGMEREIALVALGDNLLTRAWNSIRNSMSLSKSIKKRDEIADALR